MAEKVSVALILRRLAASALLVFAVPGFLAAHPHVWFESRIIVQPGSPETERLRVGFEWTFDAMFTEMIIADFDEDRDRSFSAAETKNIEAEAFSNLRHYDYFVHLRVGDREFVPRGVEEFSARIDDDRSDGGRLVYRFFLIDELPTAFAVTVFDESYYSAIEYSDEVVVAEGIESGRLRVSRSLARDRVARYQVGHGIAGVFGGNETAYGEEVTVRLEAGRGGG